MNVGTLTISLAARTAALTTASSRVKSFETSIVASAQRANRSLLLVGQAFSSLTIPIAAVGIASTKMFSDFEFELAKVQGLVGIAADRVQQWGNEILKLAPQVAKSPQELAEGLYYVTSAGIRGKETMDVLSKSALAAAAGLGETKVVANAVTSAMNAYGKENLDATAATDTLIMAIREGKVVPEEMAAAIGKIFPVAAQLGVSFNEVGAGMAAMTRTGTSAATSATYLNRVLISILRPTEAAKTALNSMGASFYQFKETLKESDGLLQVLLQIKGLVDDFGETQVAEAFPNIRALIPILDIIGKNLESNKEIWRSMLDPVGALDNAVGAVAHTFKYQWNSAISALQVSFVQLGQSVGKAVLPIMQRVVDVVKSMTSWWSSLDGSTQQLIVRMTLLVGAIGPITVVLGAVGNAVLTLIGLMNTLAVRTLMWVAAFAFVASAIKTMTEMKSATEGMESGIAQTSTALEKLSSNFGVYLNIILTRVKIFSIQIGVILGDIFSGLINGVADLINLLIKLNNKLTPNFLNVPEIGKVDFGGYYRQQLDIAEKELQNFKDLRPGGSQAWNWADQLFGKDSGFKEAGKTLWENFKDDAANSIGWIADKAAKMFDFKIPHFSFAQGMSALPGEMGPFPWGGGVAENLGVPSFYMDLTQLFKLLDVQMKQVDSAFAHFGLLINPASEKAQRLSEIIASIRERGGAVSPEDLERIKKLNRELQNEMQLFSIIQEFDGYISDEALERSYNYINSLKLTKSQLDGIKDIMTELSNANVMGITLFSKETLLSITESVAALGMTKERVNELMSVSSAFADVFTSIGEGIGNAFAGADDAFDGLLNMFVSVFKQIGAMLTKVGTLLLFTGVFSGLGAGLLAAGIGLTAIGAYASKSNQQMATGLADGGIIPSGYPNDTFPAMLSTKEAVIPLERLPQLLGISAEEREVRFHLEGDELIGLMENRFKVYNAF